MMQHPLLDDADYCNNFGSCGSCDGDGFCAGEEERGSQQKGNAGRYDGDRLERSTAAEGLAGRGRRLERRRASLASSEGAETKSEAGTASSASTATCQLRRHMVKNGDTLEGICINYGCSVADLKRLNNLLWHSDSIHLRKVLVIPDKMQASRSFVHANPSHFLRLKHDLSAHPSNFNLFVDSEAGRTKMTLKSDLEPDGTSTTGAWLH
ncbi:hypothetical protein BC830DRAFT_413310 [Chytriomyces sp. MP71]|nr:hypothetical protein BC830DRAFT_413310 [Chytriomyces sp. MP71]